MNVYNQPIQNCGYNNTALTGYSRNGKCEYSQNDRGSHHVCIDINVPQNFCAITNQPNWCSETSKCHDSKNNCEKKNWCVCQWAFSRAVDKVGCHNIKINCNATNINAYNDFREHSKYNSALKCLRKKCNLGATRSISSAVVDTTEDGLFNTSYALVHRDGQVQFHGYGRPKKTHAKLYLKIIDTYGNLISPPTEVELPPQVLDYLVGEVKGFTLNNQFYVYTNFWGERKSLDIFPRWASNYSRELYFKSVYKNYLWNTNTGKVVPLFYDVLPGPNLTNKNFIFFQDGKKILVITSVSPHRIYELDMNTGYMKPYFTTTNKLANFFDPDYRINLSGGPVRIPHKGCYLVAGHISKGGFGGLRMTFFYTFSDSYPYEVLSVSAPVSFGFSNRLEYCNQMFEYEGFLHLSIGVNDDYSTLIRVDPEEVFSILRPLD